VRQREAFSARNHVAEPCRVRVADHEPAGDGDQVAAGLGLEFAPQVAGAQQHRHVSRALTVGGAEDAGFTASGRPVAPEGVLLKPDRGDSGPS